MILKDLLKHELARVNTRKQTMYEKGRVEGYQTCLALVEKLPLIPMEEDLVDLRVKLRRILKDEVNQNIIMERGFRKSLKNLYIFCYNRIYETAEPLSPITKKQWTVIAIRSTEKDLDFFGLSRSDAIKFIRGED